MDREGRSISVLGQSGQVVVIIVGVGWFRLGMLGSVGELLGAEV